MINKNDLRKAISSIAISNAKRNTIYKAFSDLDSITKEEFDSVKSDISKVVESMLTKDTVGKANGVASLDSNGSVPIEQLGNIDTILFLIVRELPTTDIQSNKIYLVPNQDGQGNNVYVEYLYVENVWEKLGEVKAEVNLSEYVKSNDIYQCIKKDYDSSKRGGNAIAIDDSAIASGVFATAIGNNAQATYSQSTALGSNSQADSYYATALGYGAQATRKYSTVLGSNSQAIGESSTALGYKARATGESSTALGHGAEAKGYISIALGYSSQVNSRNATAIGSYAQATGNYATALGNSAQATGDYSIALGASAKTSTVSKYALGGVDKNKQVEFNLEEITYSQYGNKKYLIGLGGYDGTNITINNEAGEKILNPNIKSVQEIINSKANKTDVVCKDGDHNINGGFDDDGNKCPSGNYGCIDIGFGNNQGTGESNISIGKRNSILDGNNNICIGDSNNISDSNICIGQNVNLGGISESIGIGEYINMNTDNGGMYNTIIGSYDSENAAVIPNGFISIGYTPYNANTGNIIYQIGGYEPINEEAYNLETTLDYNNQHKKYIYGIGGYNGKDPIVTKAKSLQEVLDTKANKTEIPTKLNNITAATTTEDMITKFNDLLADLKAKGYMEADTPQ